MTTHVEHPQVPDGNCVDRFYPADILPKIQWLLAALADIEVAHARRLETLKSSAIDEDRKARLISDLTWGHRQQRAYYVRKLSALEKRMDAAFG